MTASTATTTASRLRFGQIVRYEGSITRLHGGWYRISGTYGASGRYDLTPYWGRDCGEPLRRVRRESVTPVKVEHYTCRECHLEHSAERGAARYPCGLAALGDPEPLGDIGGEQDIPALAGAQPAQLSLFADEADIPRFGADEYLTW